MEGQEDNALGLGVSDGDDEGDACGAALAESDDYEALLGGLLDRADAGELDDRDFERVDMGDDVLGDEDLEDEDLEDEDLEDEDLDDEDLDEQDSDDAATAPGRRRRARRRRRRASARALTVLRKTAFDYSFLANGTSMSITLRKSLSARSDYHYWLGVRLHNVDIEQTGSTIDVDVFDTLPSRHDPQEFTATSARMTVSIKSTSSAPTLLLHASSEGAPFFKIRVLATKSGSGGRLYAEISAVLYVRPI